ncbi:MAG: winged helix-turn-helix domain-containing protein [Myxococcota bacterium]
MMSRILVVGVPESEHSELRSAVWREGLELVLSGVEDLRRRLDRVPIDAVVANLTRNDVRNRIDFERPDVPIVAFEGVPKVIERLRGLFSLGTLRLSGATVDLETRAAMRNDGSVLSLTANEVALIRFLARNLDEVVPERELLQKVWGYMPSVRTRAVSSTVYRLRQKVEADPKSPVNLLSEYGRGYRLALPSPRSDANPGLSVPRDGFVGRERDLEVLREAVLTRRMITITGPGGVGKSRVALEFLHRLQPVSDRTIRWVELADAQNEQDVRNAITTALGCAPDASASDHRMVGVLDTSSPLLLCLNDCDGVAAELAQLATTWLDVCSGLTLLVTCRRPLGIRGDRQVRLGPLPVPSNDSFGAALASEAITLLLRRAGDRSGSFRLTVDNRASLVRIVSAMDGLPLGIELVAALATALPLEDLATELEGSGELPQAREAGRASRHRSLTATLAWSFRRLDAVPRSVLGQLSVFDGGFTLEAAAAVVQGPTPVAATIHLLVEWSWVRRRPSGRFDLLRVVRRFVEDETDKPVLRAARLRHRDYFAAPREWPIAEMRNLVVACRRAVEEKQVDPVLLFTAWCLLRRAGQFDTGVELALRTLPLCHELPDLVRVARIAGEAQVLAGSPHDARTNYDLALEAARELGNPVLLGKALASRAFAAWPDEPELAREFLLEARQLGEANGDEAGVWLARARLAKQYLNSGDYEKAITEYESLLEDHPYPRDTAVAVNLGSAYAMIGDATRATQWHERALSWAEDRDDDVARVLVMGNQALFAADNGDQDLAKELFRSAIDMARRAGAHRSAGWNLGRLGMLLLDDGDVEDALRVLHEALSTLRIAGSAVDLAFVLARLAEAGLAKNRLDDAERDLEEGRRQFPRGCPGPSRVDLLVVEARLQLARGDRTSAMASVAAARNIVTSEPVGLGPRIQRRLVEVELTLAHPA